MSEQTRTSSRTWISSPSHDLPAVELDETIPPTRNRVKKSSALICYQMLTIGAKLLWLVNKSSGLISYCCIVATYFLQEKSLLQGKLDSYCFRFLSQDGGWCAWSGDAPLLGLPEAPREIEPAPFWEGGTKGGNCQLSRPDGSKISGVNTRVPAGHLMVQRRPTCHDGEPPRHLAAARLFHLLLC